MATSDDTAAEIVTEPTADAPLLLSAHPGSECPECGTGGFKKAIDVTATGGEQGEYRATLSAAVECEFCGLFAEEEF